jgi:hypothetical protein
MREIADKTEACQCALSEEEHGALANHLEGVTITGNEAQERRAAQQYDRATQFGF